MTTSAQEWQRFAAELAHAPDVIASLLVVHVNDGHGRCVACTRPGRGTPHAPWPCALARMATQAARKGAVPEKPTA